MSVAVFFITYCDGDVYKHIEADVKRCVELTVTKQIRLQEIQSEEEIERSIELLNNDPELNSLKVDKVHVVTLADASFPDHKNMLNAVKAFTCAMERFRRVASESVYCLIDITAVKFKNGPNEPVYKAVEEYKSFMKTQDRNLRLYFIDNNVNDKKFKAGKRAVALNICTALLEGHIDSIQGEGFKWSTLQYILFDVRGYLNDYVEHKRLIDKINGVLISPSESEKDVDKVLEDYLKRPDFSSVLNELVMLPVRYGFFYDGKLLHPKRALKEALNGKPYEDISRKLYGQDEGPLDAILIEKAKKQISDKALEDMAERLLETESLPFVEGDVASEHSLLWHLEKKRISLCRKENVTPQGVFRYRKQKPLEIVREVLQNRNCDKYLSFCNEQRAGFLESLIEKIRAKKVSFVADTRLREKEINARLKEAAFGTEDNLQLTEAAEAAYQEIRQTQVKLSVPDSIYTVAGYAEYFTPWFLLKSDPNLYTGQKTMVEGFQGACQRFIIVSPEAAFNRVKKRIGDNETAWGYNGDTCSIESLLVKSFYDNKAPMEIYQQLRGKSDAV